MKNEDITPCEGCGNPSLHIDKDGFGICRECYNSYLEDIANQIIKYLKKYTLINLATLERSCQIPESTIRLVMVGKRNLPLKYVIVIKEALIPYGLIIK